MHAVSRILFLLFFVLSTTFLHASPPRKTENVPPVKSILLNRVEKPIVIDGILESAWSRADSVTDFIQHSPYYGKEPLYPVVARVLTTDEALYCAIVSYQPEETIVRKKGVVDQFSGDVVSIMLDTFGDKRSAYKLAVSASGVRVDARLLDDARNRDYNWDGVWFAESRIYDWGYVVEMEIPYKSIQYSGNVQTWGIDFDRWAPHIKEDVYWNKYAENEGLRVSKFGALNLNGFSPSVHGTNLEIYPVVFTKAQYLRPGEYAVRPVAGIDLFYNPSPQLTLQATFNPDFAQIEADPFSFNISRYESYFSERRPFFTKGNEIFMSSGRQNNTGFYAPMELFYSRRIGRMLPDGSEVPLLFGSKFSGRSNSYEYGGLLAATDRVEYLNRGVFKTEPDAWFGVGRLRKQIFDNSSIGLLFIGRRSEHKDNGLISLDGAFRTSEGQFSYQLARSFTEGSGGLAFSAGYLSFGDAWVHLAKARFVENAFDIQTIGFVPWKGTAEVTLITGPRWYYEQGDLQSLFIYFGPTTYWEKTDNYIDHGGVVGLNMSFRSGWGYEVTVVVGTSRDEGVQYGYHSVSFNTWAQPTPTFNFNFNTGYERGFNFARYYLAGLAFANASFGWQIDDMFSIGSSLGTFVEYNPGGAVEDYVVNGRPTLSITPVNDMNFRFYIDNLFVHSSDKMERAVVGALFTYNYSPKSFIYFAFNELQDRAPDANGMIPSGLRIRDRAVVVKISYLYYF